MDRHYKLVAIGLTTGTWLILLLLLLLVPESDVPQNLFLFGVGTVFALGIIVAVLRTHRES